MVKTGKDKSLQRRVAGDEHECVLFAVVGMSPAVLTETVWALASEKPALVPHRVIAVTTRRGRDVIVSELLTKRKEFNGRSVWDCLREALAKEGFDTEGRLRFGDSGSDIRVLTIHEKGGSRELEDITTPAENMAVADFLLEHLRGFVENPDVRVIASIAGGRKTMGALLFACMTLVGRESDRVTHVLVDDPYDGALNPRFYFPKQPAAKLVTPQGRSVLASSARIRLADIPFVPLRNRFQDLGQKPGTYSTMVRRFSRELLGTAAQPVRVEVLPDLPGVRIDGKQVRLRERALLTLQFLMSIRENLPAGHIEAEQPLREFLKAQSCDTAHKWADKLVVEDLKRELNYLRTAFQKAGITWGPGLRQHSLKLPPFVLVGRR